MHQPGQVQALVGAGAGAAKHMLRPSVVRAQPSPERKGPELQASDAEGVRSGSGSGSNVPGGDINTPASCLHHKFFCSATGTMVPLFVRARIVCQEQLRLC